MQYSDPSFRVDKKDWLKGNNSYDDYPEGGAKYSTVGINAFSKPGLLSQAPALGSTVTSSLLPEGVISWGIGSGSSAPAVVAVLSNSSNDARFATVNVSTGALTTVGSDDTTRNYIEGVTDTVFYDGSFYTTSETDICKNSVDLVTRDETWWTSTKSQSALTTGIPHPMLVYESILYIADGRYLHKLDGSDVSTQVWDAPPDHIITAMVEYNGLMYIVAEPYKNLAGTVHGLSQMFSWDGLLESWYEQYFLDYRVNSLFVYKNKLYGWTNEFVGLWTGSELDPIFPVENQVFKHQITATSDSMIYADGGTIIRYGKPFTPTLAKQFYRFINSAALDFAGIISVSGNNLIASEKHATASLNYYIDNVNTPASSGSRTLTFNTRYMTHPVRPRAIALQADVLASGQIIKIGYINDRGETVYSNTDSGQFAYATTKMQSKKRWRFEFHSVKATREITPVIQITGAPHLKCVDYFYKPSEEKTED